VTTPASHPTTREIRDLSDEEARAALLLKWGDTEPGVIPAWIAEMDYALDPVVSDALVAAVRRGAVGYPPHGDAWVGDAFAGFAERQWGWAAPADAAVVVGGVLDGLRLVLDTLCPPGPVVVPLPCYPPFRELVAMCGRELVPVAHDPDVATASLDLVGLEQAFAAGARTLVLCSPHNPMGRVWGRTELEALRDLTDQYDVRVVADEIHAPLTLPGATFTPYLTVDPRAVLVTSASKSFNIPGVHCGLVLALDPDDQARLRGVPLLQNFGYSPLGMAAAVAAYGEGDAWLESLVARLAGQRDHLRDLLAQRLPRARPWPLEATYLAWLDLRAYGVADVAAAALAHGLRVSPGADYQPGLEGHVRLNLATSPERLTRIVERLAAAVGAPAS